MEQSQQLDKKKFDSEPFYDNKYITTKTKSHNGTVNKNFHDNKIPEEGVRCPCLSVILLYSVVKVDKKYCPQFLLEECKYAVKKIKNFINEDINLD